MSSPALSRCSAAEPDTSAPIAFSAAMQEVMRAADDVAATPATVLLLGESGTGKELLARYLHERSGRHGAWVAVNCAALPGDLLESELFGHERGAFTGAVERRAGRFEQAQHGTLLLDEISELPLRLQAKLLRVLQEREVDRVGGQKPLRIDVRVIATSNRDLAGMVRAGQFRADLFYRLNVFPIVVPPLRHRTEDLEAIAAALLSESARALGRPAPRLDDSALTVLRTYGFPGNVRELRNLIDRAVVRCRGPVLHAIHLARLGDDGAAQPPVILAAPQDQRRFPDALPLDLDELERLAITEALRRVGGNRTHAARLLGIGLRTLRNKLRGYREGGIEIEPAGAADGQIRPIETASIDPSSEDGERACISQEHRP